MLGPLGRVCRSGVLLSPEDSLAWPITSSLFVLGCMSAGTNAGYRLVSWLSSRTAIVSTLPAPLLPTPWSARLSALGFLWYVLRNQTQKRLTRLQVCDADVQETRSSVGIFASRVYRTPSRTYPICTIPVRSFPSVKGKVCTIIVQPSCLNMS